MNSVLHKTASAFCKEGDSRLRIQIYSDLHLEHSKGRIPEVADGADCVVIAGDTAVPLSTSLMEIRRVIEASIPVVVVAGNHEFYRTELPSEIEHGRLLAKQLGIHFLENNSVEIGGVRFVGATLWTDYALFGDALRPLAMDDARRSMNDHRLIKWQKEPWRRFRPHEALALHWQSRSFIEKTLAEHFAGPTVVVTHHAPEPASLQQGWQKNHLSAAYASDLNEVITRFAPHLWVHGHIHRRVDYRVGLTRIVSNPCGYPGEVTGFDPSLMVEVGS